jgi:hypothetical protein
MVMSGTAAAASDHRLVVWVPEAGKGAPKPTGSGITDLKVEAVAGGFYVTGTTECAYQLSIDGADVSAAPLVAC